MKKVLKKTGTVLTVLLFILAILAMRSGLWMLSTWEHLQTEELIFHLMAPMEGTNEELISGFMTTCLLPALTIGLLFSILLFLFHKKKILYRIAHGIAVGTSILLIGFTIWMIWSDLNMDDYVEAQNTYSTFLDENYVDPQEVTLTFPRKKRNLIHIYLESLETTYADTANGGAFTYNVIPEITKLAQTYEDFSGLNKRLNGAISLTGSTWTMGALFSQTAGLPLNLPIDGNAMSGQTTFLPKVTALGDILEAAGYRQAFLIGSKAAFGGRELYFEEHGNYQIWDYDYFRINGNIPEDYYVWWGFEDQYLFEFAKEKLTWLSQQEEAFNLTMLTVDTHYEDGYVCSDCIDYYKNDPYSNVMRCSSSKIYEFISWIQEQDFYENTTIVLTGDHPTMDADYCQNVPENYQRKVFTIYINAPVSVENSTYRTYSTFDIFPTTLASLGVQIDGNRLALGTNLFSETATFCEEYGAAFVDEELKKKSTLMEELTSDVTYADVAVIITPYKPILKTFDVLINEMDYSVEIVDMRCLVWTKEDKSDAKWYIQPYEEDQDYLFTIPTSDFPDDAARFYAEAFAYAENTIMYSLGTAEIDITN